MKRAKRITKALPPCSSVEGSARSFGEAKSISLAVSGQRRMQRSTYHKRKDQSTFFGSQQAAAPLSRYLGRIFPLRGETRRCRERGSPRSRFSTWFKASSPSNVLPDLSSTLQGYAYYSRLLRCETHRAVRMGSVTVIVFVLREMGCRRTASELFIRRPLGIDLGHSVVNGCPFVNTNCAVRVSFNGTDSHVCWDTRVLRILARNITQEGSEFKNLSLDARGPIQLRRFNKLRQKDIYN